MNKQEILKKAETILEERRKQKDEENKKYEYIRICLSAQICPRCGESVKLTYMALHSGKHNEYNCVNCGKFDFWSFID